MGFLFLENISKINIQKNESSTNESSEKIIYTNININNIEDILNNFLDEYNEILKYYLYIDENKWCIFFNVDMNQYDAMVKTMFEIKLYKDIDNNSIVHISKEINEHEQWMEIYKKLVLILK
jgi:2-oxoglutarate dehydrogenase complex dehydrogenase (E1) component-like enzyme